VKLSTRRAFIFIFVLGLFVLAARGIQDPDFWWHLRTGQYIVQTRSVPQRDLYSFTRPDAPWITHEWLAEVIIYLVYRTLSWAGLSVLFGGIISAAFLITYIRCPGRPYVAGICVLAGAIASANAWGVRPQMFSLLLASLVLLLLEQAGHPASNPRRVWWTVPLMLVWVNLHAGFAVGLALMFLTLIGWLLEVWVGQRAWADARSRLRTLGLALLACLAVVPLNPSGIKLYSYPLETLRSRTMQKYIVEWASPNFHDHDFLPLLGLLLLLFFSLGISRRNLRATQLILLLATAYGALTSMRHVPMLALVAVPILAELLSGVMEDHGWTWLFQPGPAPNAVKTAFNLVLIAAMAAFVVIRVAVMAKRQPHLEAQHFPAAAAEFIAAQHLPAPMFNYYDWGGYFVWKLYPMYRVFIDGRADVYGDAMMDTFTQTSSGEEHWREGLERFHIRTVVVPPKTGLAGILRENLRWRQVFADDQAVIFTKK